MIQLRQQHQLTPALVLPAHLSLRAPFYEALGRRFAELGIDRVRSDLLRPIDGVWQAAANRVFAQRVGRLNRTLAQRCESGLGVQVAWTATIARPRCSAGLATAAEEAAFVVGVAHHRDRLPPWVASIDLVESTR
ncbi:MAG: hypothetical protein ACF788_00920 [Novipirellula sp. JB048]